MIIIMFGAGHGNWYAHNAQNIAIFVRMYFKFTGLRGSFLSPGKNVFLRARVLVIGLSSQQVSKTAFRSRCARPDGTLHM